MGLAPLKSVPELRRTITGFPLISLRKSEGEVDVGASIKPLSRFSRVAASRFGAMLLGLANQVSEERAHSSLTLAERFYAAVLFSARRGNPKNYLSIPTLNVSLSNKALR